MTGRIRDEDIARSASARAIAEVVGEYLQLRNAGGGSLKGLCPFHDEKTPSFNVTPGRGLYYCFSCAEGGDVIRFVQKIDNLSFAEAVERLAARAGIELRYEQGGHVPGQEQSQRRRLLEAHKAAADFYAEQLAPAAQAGRDFLTERGFELADAGASASATRRPSGRTFTQHLRGRGFTDDELLLAGLASQGSRGLIDQFRGRLIWPIRDITGDVIAFGARKLDPEDDGPKYLNTPETPLFKKSSVLYGADLAKREIAHRRQAVIVEGYTDVMACHLSGVTTAVATSGTSFGDGHVKVLRRLLMDADQFLGEVVFTFDGDAAGQRAALRAFELEERSSRRPSWRSVRRAGPVRPAGRSTAAAVRDLVASASRCSSSPSAATLPSTTWRPTRAGSRPGRGRPDHRPDQGPGLRDRYAVSLDRWLGMLNEELRARPGPRPRRAAGPRRRGPPERIAPAERLRQLVGPGQAAGTLRRRHERRHGIRRRQRGRRRQPG